MKHRGIVILYLSKVTRSLNKTRRFSVDTALCQCCASDRQAVRAEYKMTLTIRAATIL